MSQENVNVVMAAWAAWARGDFQASLDAYAENAVWDDTLYRPDGAVHVGHGALIEVSRSWLGTWESYDVRTDDVLDAGGDRVAVTLTETGKGKGSGVELSHQWGVVMTVRDRKIVHTVVYRSPEEALEAAGLSE
jgi:ketosteroid isomerase-like protein